MGRPTRREVIAAGLLLLSGTRAMAAEADDAWKTDSKVLFPTPVFEMDLQPSTTNAWSLSKDAFEAVRRLQARSDLGAADRTALERLALEYDGRLSPSLRDLRHVVSFTRTNMGSIQLGVQAIAINSRHGRPSVPIYPHRPASEVDVNGPPQPIDVDSIDELREMGRDFAEKARTSLKEGLLLLRTSKVDALSPSAREAYLGMISAFEFSLGVAGRFAELDGPRGLEAETIKAYAEFFEAENKALEPLPDARAKVVVAYKRAAAVLARLEFELARNAGQARFLHGELDKLGPLTPPKK